MRVFDQGALYRVTVSESEVYDFGVRWPCYGPYRALSFTFDKHNGDLVDLVGSTARNDGSGILALCNDAKHYGATRLALDF